tara:strand:+ start:192 stop:413 length:222 start_codon:yes stop_codon:yes gene_type:complete
MSDNSNYQRKNVFKVTALDDKLETPASEDMDAPDKPLEKVKAYDYDDPNRIMNFINHETVIMQELDSEDELPR